MKDFNGHFKAWFRVKTGTPGGSVIFGVVENSPEYKDGQFVRTDEVIHFSHSKDFIETKNHRYTLGMKMEKESNRKTVLEQFGMENHVAQLEYM